jgi:pimeloyl-ACP methyl ester carboxylesterase
LSSDPPETFSTTNYANCLAGFFNTLGIACAHVVALSWGGILAQEFYRLYPERLCSLVLAGTYAGWKGSLPEAVWKERLETCLLEAMGPPDVVTARFLPGMFTGAASPVLREELSAIIAGFHPMGFRVMSKSSAAMDTTDLLPRIHVPTLVLWGDADLRSPMHVAEQLHAAIPGAELAVIRNAGHVSNMEQPDAFNAHVRRFCLEHDCASTRG